LQLRAAEGSVLLEQLQTRLQKLDLQLRTRMLCGAWLPVPFYGYRRVINSKTGSPFRKRSFSEKQCALPMAFGKRFKACDVGL
jgi:hypothetical protein